MPNSAARSTGGAERWTPLAAQHRQARRRQERSRRPCPRPGLPAPSSQEPRHGCLLLDADRWGKPPFCLALKTQVPKAVLVPAGGGWSCWGLAPEGPRPPTPIFPPAPGPGTPARSCPPARAREGLLRFASLWELQSLNQSSNPGGAGGRLLDEGERVRRNTVIASGLGKEVHLATFFKSG